MEKSDWVDKFAKKQTHVEDLQVLLNKREEKLIQLQKSYQNIELKFSELQRNFETEKRNSEDLEKVLDWTKKILKSKCADIEELEHRLQCFEITKSQLEFELHMLLMQMEEELKSKNCLNEKLNQQLNNVKFLLEIERNRRFPSDHYIKVETDVHMVIEQQLKEQSRIKEDVLKQVESFKRKMKDYNRKVEEVHADKNKQAILTEKVRRKVKVLETELTEIRTELVLNANKSTIFLENKKKMDSKICALEKKLEEKRLENKALTSENRSIKSELSNLKAVQISIQTLYSMIDGLLDQIVDDSRERLAQEKIIRKLQKKLHEHVKKK